jgi:glutaredoxin
MGEESPRPALSRTPLGIRIVTSESNTGIAHPRSHGDETGHARLPASIGSAALFFALAVFVLAVVDRTHGLPFMPMSWYTNRALWYLLALGSLLAGAFLLRSAGRETPVDAESHPLDGSRAFETLIFYTRRGCHLCDEALLVLKRHQRFLPEIRIVDVDADPSLVERFDTCVPVVEIDGKVRFRGRINPVLLQRMIDVELARRELRLES